jgi:hypothetical protein
MTFGRKTANGTHHFADMVKPYEHANPKRLAILERALRKTSPFPNPDLKVQPQSKLEELNPTLEPRPTCR